MSKWTKEELDYVEEKFKKGLSAEEISKEGKKDKLLDRSTLSVEYKTYPTLCDMLDKGKSYEEVAKLYNRSTKDVKSIEKRYNEIKKDKFTNDKSTNDKPAFDKFQNNDTQKTMYTNVGGYVLNNDNSFDLNQFHDINRKMDAFLKFYENISRLNKLKSEKIIEAKLYSSIYDKLNMLKFDMDTFVNSLCEQNTNLKLSEDNLNNNNLNNNNDVQDIKKINEIKKPHDSDSDDVEIEIPVKTFKKRLI